MLEEKARKAAAEKEQIIRRRKKITPVRFKRHSKIPANQLIGAQQVLDSDEEYETVSETGDSPPKDTTVARSYGGAKPKSNFQLITQQQDYVKDILSQAVSVNKKLLEIPLTIKPKLGLPTPPRRPKDADKLQLTPASTSAFTSRNPKTSSPKEGKPAMTSQKLSRQIGEKTSENSIGDETNVRLSPVSGAIIEDNCGHVVSNTSETVEIRRSKRIPKANRTEKYGAIRLGL